MTDPLGAGDGEEFSRRLFLLVDAKGYGDGDTLLQRDFQQAIPRLVQASANAAGLRVADWQTQRQGDALFAVLPAGSSEPALVDTFIRALEANLRNFNANRLPRAWLRIRATVHYGPASGGDLGHVGPAPVELARLNASEALHTALADAPEACLALGLSPRVYTDVVLAGYTTLRAEWFRAAAVAEKNYRGTIWIWVPSVSAPADAAPPVPRNGVPTEAEQSARPAPASATVIQVFHDVEAHHGVFGIKL